MNSSSRVALTFLVICFVAIAFVSGMEGDVGVCIRNCAQCKQMFGAYFKGEKCADYCLKYKGKLIPDCQDEISIMPFLQPLNNDY